MRGWWQAEALTSMSPAPLQGALGSSKIPIPSNQPLLALRPPIKADI